MAKTTAGISFISKQAHMVTYSNYIFEGWLEIIQNAEEKQKPPTTLFRYLQGLEEDEVRLLQKEIQDGNIVLTRGPEEEDEMDMLERIKQMKQDRLLQEELIVVYQELDKESGFSTWDEIKSKYNISPLVYDRFLVLCDDWLKSRLQVACKKIAFPKDVVEYAEWTIKVKKEESANTMNVPWSIFVVSLRVEQRSYLQRHFNQHIPIDLCVLDNTETTHCKKQWDSSAFKDLLDGVLDVCEESNKQFVFLAFVGLDDFIQLQNSFKDMVPNLKTHFFGALHYQCKVPYMGAIQYFTVLAFLIRREVFEGYSDSLAVGEQSMVLDAGFLDFEDVHVKELTDAMYLRVKKKGAPCSDLASEITLSYANLCYIVISLLIHLPVVIVTRAVIRTWKVDYVS